MSRTTPPPELHLPDLPEVAVSLGPAAMPPRTAVPWGQRLRDVLSSYLPLLLMALLAASTWWLVRHTPAPAGPAAAPALRHDPDYTMEGFSITRFAADGRFALRIDGDVLRHYPDTDRLEIDGVRIVALAPDGRRTEARARRALANGDASEVQLIGAAEVRSQIDGDDALEIEGEFLHAFLRFERLRSHLPVLVRHGASQTRAAGLDYDHLARVVQFAGPVHSSFVQPGAAAPRRQETR